MAHSMTQEGIEKARETANRVGGAASGMMQSAQEMAGEWTRKAQENLESASDAASSYVDQGRKKAEALGRSVTDQVHDRPVSALLMAAGIGFLFGALIMRR